MWVLGVSGARGQTGLIGDLQQECKGTRPLDLLQAKWWDTEWGARKTAGAPCIYGLTTGLEIIPSHIATWAVRFQSIGSITVTTGPQARGVTASE